MITTETAFKISKEDITWLKQYIKNSSPSGNEVSGQKIWLDYITPYIDDYFTDAYGNVAAVINPGQKFKVVIEAHADEIAWYVHFITKDGFLHVEKNGGIDPGIAPSQRVIIRTETGTVKGIFGWPAIHTRSSSKQPTPDNIFVDCGCRSKKEVEELGIQIGDCITYESGLSVLNKRFFVGRGQDNKMGGYMIANVAKLLRENDVKLPYTLYIVNAVQEEVGLRGASMMSNRIQPDVAIVTDVTHATHTPLVSELKQGDIALGRGPVIKKAPPIHNKLREYIVNTARENNIPFQLSVSAKKSGTDADAFAYTKAGIPSALISLPLRYMHTTVETTAKSDIRNTVKLLYEVVQNMSPDFDFKYL
ncbi:M20/M25/M40 family metallo-hydrolase [Chryseosolibacter indicus]|uniref:M20/M25/M40 family metallo-hydrolase n=1 Tax=Chryseosolibacter indicus TaxID=2782351 RepID=A0ABS5VN60_9BACT|nr:M20/M25/M40 family metallo-hydrolase [Chryseosolibacter indicus]MBT1702868.1 M20/M25/M40 family metallo-hydrolase [Chryseosolibacter indicus]